MKAIHLALLGNPVEHSLSPLIQQSFAEQFGFSINYELQQCTAEQFPAAVHKLQQAGAAGCNITLPLKTLACELADSVSRAAQVSGAANTLVFTKQGIYAENTDGKGWLADLNQRENKISGKSVCLLGAGGAAAGILPEILNLAPGSLMIANRDTAKAEGILRNNTRANWRVISLDMLAADTVNTYDLVINTTSLGHQGRLPAMPAEMFNPEALFYDLNYGQAAQPAQEWCRRQGINYQDGTGMLVEQAALGFTLWTGKTPSTATILKQLRAAPE